MTGLILTSRSLAWWDLANHRSPQNLHTQMIVDRTLISCQKSAWYNLLLVLSIFLCRTSKNSARFLGYLFVYMLLYFSIYIPSYFDFCICTCFHCSPFPIALWLFSGSSSWNQCFLQKELQAVGAHSMLSAYNHENCCTVTCSPPPVGNFCLFLFTFLIAACPNIDSEVALTTTLNSWISLTSHLFPHIFSTPTSFQKLL